MKHATHHHLRDRSLKRRYRRAAIVATLLLALATVAVFLKRNPFVHGYEIRAVFSSAAQLKRGAEVRTAGIKVGQVAGIESGPQNTAMVTMAIDAEGRPIHADATFTIKPRLVLEGNAYVDARPGTSAAPELRSGATVSITHTAISVQLDQVLDVLNIPTRDALQNSVAQLANGLGGSAKASNLPPGYAALREAVRQFDGALQPTAEVAQAARGTRPGDLSRAIGSTGATTAQLAENPHAVADIVTSYNAVFAALAVEDRALAASISGFDSVLAAAPTPLRQIDAALPPLTSFANELRPALHAAPATLADTNQLLDQVALAVRPGELPALVTDLAPVLARLPGLEQRLQTLFSYTTPVTDCIATHVVPTLTAKIQDGANTSGDPVYLDLMHLFTGLTAFSSAVDGNGGTVRLGVTTGDRIVDTVFPGLGQVVGSLPNVDGVRPSWLGFGVNPPFRPDQPCARQRLPNLNVESGPLPAWASSARGAKTPSTVGARR
jgi:ABC-type transporter Mla subunit MlaD